jgi:hypothetical protein
MREYYESKIGGFMKDIILIVTIIILLGTLIYISITLTNATNLAEMYERKYDNLIIGYEKYIKNSEEMQQSYAQQVVLYDEKSKADDEMIEYQTNKIKSLESKLENLTEKYVDLIN